MTLSRRQTLPVSSCTGAVAKFAVLKTLLLHCGRRWEVSNKAELSDLPADVPVQPAAVLAAAIRQQQSGPRSPLDFGDLVALLVTNAHRPHPPTVQIILLSVGRRGQATPPRLADIILF